jgi:hypothetical protein
MVRVISSAPVLPLVNSLGWPAKHKPARALSHNCWLLGRGGCHTRLHVRFNGAHGDAIDAIGWLAHLLVPPLVEREVQAAALNDLQCPAMLDQPATHRGPRTCMGCAQGISGSSGHESVSGCRRRSHGGGGGRGEDGSPKHQCERPWQTCRALPCVSPWRQSQSRCRPGASCPSRVPSGPSECTPNWLAWGSRRAMMMETTLATVPRQRGGWDTRCGGPRAAGQAVLVDRSASPGVPRGRPEALMGHWQCLRLAGRPAGRSPAALPQPGAGHQAAISRRDTPPFFGPTANGRWTRSFHFFT